MKLLQTSLLLFFASTLIAEERPNVILMLVDDFGRELIGALGGESYETPHIDRLAHDGMMFDLCYATPLCSPTRTMLLSGNYSFRNYTAWGEYDFDRQPTIANALANAGYATAVTGKWHLGGWEKKPFGPTQAGFANYATFNYAEQLEEDDAGIGNFFWNTHLWVDGERVRLGQRYSSAYFRDFAVRTNEEHQDQKTPFFLYYPLMLAHRPFMPTDLSEATGVDFRGRRGELKHFSEMVTYVDNIVGTLRKTLERTGQSENTLLIFTADNGTDNVGEARELRSQWKGQSIKGGKYVPSELGANVPFFACWPGTIAAGSRYQKPIDFTDLYPTLCRLAQADCPETLDGHDLTPVFRGEGDSSRKYAYTWGIFEYSSKKYKTPIEFREELLHIIRDERWKYLSNGNLFDISADPMEKNVLDQDQYPEVRARMRAALETLRDTEPKRW